MQAFLNRLDLMLGSLHPRELTASLGVRWLDVCNKRKSDLSSGFHPLHDPRGAFAVERHIRTHLAVRIKRADVCCFFILTR
jgi:hypothetical protein